jgi:hypothetical protein
VLVHVYKAWRHNMACGINALLSFNRLVGYGRNLFSLDADVAHRVETGFRVDHPTAGYH